MPKKSLISAGIQLHSRPKAPKGLESTNRLFLSRRLPWPPSSPSWKTSGEAIRVGPNPGSTRVSPKVRWRQQDFPKNYGHQPPVLVDSEEHTACIAYRCLSPSSSTERLIPECRDARQLSCLLILMHLRCISSQKSRIWFSLIWLVKDLKISRRDAFGHAS